MIKTVINHLKKGKFSKHIVFEHVLPKYDGSFIPLDILETKTFKELLQKKGIEKLYSHQAQAYKEIKNKKDIIITTPTASGKTLCYNMPILENMFCNNNEKALYLFPIKALGYDQKKQLETLIAKSELENSISIQLIDGDTDKKKRRSILSSPPNIIISNVDILHYSILSKINEWEDFLKDLKYIVLDELHTYRGIFGSHVYNLFERFLRLMPNVQIISSSATIGNPVSFATSLFDRPFININENGAPGGEQHILVFNPDIAPSTLATYILNTNIASGIKTICFTKSRKETETIFSYLIKSDPTCMSTVSSYRAGFLPDERRKIEHRFLNDELKAVISTSAFELGMDIGGIDSTILVGYPGSLISLWQRAGRSGRNLKKNLIILIAGYDALDQYYAKKPEYLVKSSFEDITVDRENIEINEKHIICAAYEKPIKKCEKYYKKHELEINNLINKNLLFTEVSGEQYITLKRYPYGDINLRMTGDTYTITNNNILMGTNSGKRVYAEMFEGAVYLHRGNTFLVKKVEKAKLNINVVPANINYYTSPLLTKQIFISKTLDEFSYNNVTSSFVELEVSETLTGYEKISSPSREKIQTIPLNKEPITFNTKGLCLKIPNYDNLPYNFIGSIHAIEHAIIAMIPTIILCDRGDIGGIAYPMHPQTETPAIFVYDGYPGGIGITKRMFSSIDNLLRITLNQIKSCNCENGCPGCIFSPKCGSGNYPLDKNGAISILGDLLVNKKYKLEKRKYKNIMGGKTIVFDLETKFSADDVGGWKNAHKMGVSVAVAYCFEEDNYMTFTEDKINEFIFLLEQSACIIGFNIIDFDLKVLSGYRTLSLQHVLKLDLLADIRKITGRRFSLDSIAKTTLKTAKTANGLLALEWYKEGKIDQIINYCKKDVEITKDILLYGIKNKYILTLAKDSIIKIPINWEHYTSLL